MEDRIKKLEVITKRLMRRSHKVAKAIVTPYPISYCASGDAVTGDVLKYMFPGDGIISVALFHFDRKAKDGIEVTVRIDSASGSSSKSFIVDKQDLKLKPDIGVLSGDRLTVSIKSINIEHDVKEAWASFLWIPDVSESKIRQCLIESLEKNESDNAQE